MIIYYAQEEGAHLQELYTHSTASEILRQAYRARGYHYMSIKLKERVIHAHSIVVGRWRYDAMRGKTFKICKKQIYKAVVLNAHDRVIARRGELEKLFYTHKISLAEIRMPDYAKMFKELLEIPGAWKKIDLVESWWNEAAQPLPSPKGETRSGAEDIKERIHLSNSSDHLVRAGVYSARLFFCNVPRGITCKYNFVISPRRRSPFSF